MPFVTRDFFLEFIPNVLAAFHAALTFGPPRLKELLIAEP
jgi:hypothetical protein